RCGTYWAVVPGGADQPALCFLCLGAATPPASRWPARWAAAACCAMLLLVGGLFAASVQRTPLIAAPATPPADAALGPSDAALRLSGPGMAPFAALPPRDGPASPAHKRAVPLTRRGPLVVAAETGPAAFRRLRTDTEDDLRQQAALFPEIGLGAS